MNLVDFLRNRWVRAGLAVATLIALACGAGGATPPDLNPKPTGNPPAPQVSLITIHPRNEIPGFRHIYLGVQVRSAEGVRPARIIVHVDAIDDQGGKGMPSPTFLPYDATVGSGWEYVLKLSADWKHTIYATIRGTVAERSAGEYLECWIWDGVNYLAQEYKPAMDKKAPHIPQTVSCSADIPPVAAN